MSDYITSFKMSKYIISFKREDGTFRVWNSATEKIETLPKLPLGNGNLRKFIMLTHKDNEATDLFLIEYAEKFKQWCIELKNSILNIDYANYYSDYTAVTCTFNRYCLKYYRNHTPISKTEYEWFERCANSGIQYLRDNDITKKCWSYDFKNQYGLILYSDNKIPTCEGKETKLKKLPKRKDLEAGFYHVKISCDNDDFHKMFLFSKSHVYLKESLQFAMKHSKEFDVTIELITDGKPNAYLYDEDDMVTLNSITKEWFENLTKLRKKFKDNRLLKHLISSAWGHLNAGNKIYKTFEEIEQEGLDVGMTCEYDYKILKYEEYLDHPKYGNRECYTLLKTDKPYKHNIRLKPWVTALARNLTASIVLNDIDKVIRVQTASVSFTREQEFDDVNLVPEEKTTGKIHWYHVNRYHNITTGYKTKDLQRQEQEQ